MKDDDKIIATLNGYGSDIEDTTGAATETSGEVLTEGSTPPVCDFCGEVRTDCGLWESPTGSMLCEKCIESMRDYMGYHRVNATISAITGTRN